MVGANEGYDEIENIEQNKNQDDGSVARKCPGPAIVQGLAELLRHIRRVKLYVGAEFDDVGQHCTKVTCIGHALC